ncbi:UCH-domain-containing protein [Ceratobasidium sp. AG-I]|nr:UCH-domain-containing protein [Ceratobasidium sp. AG-I]
MSSGAPDRRTAKPNGSTPQPGPSNTPHQQHYGYGMPQYMSPYPIQHMPPASQMYPQPHHIVPYPPYGYPPHGYQHPAHPPQGYHPQMSYVPHLSAPHPHYPSPGIPSPYQHNAPPWSPAPQPMPHPDSGLSTPPVYAPQAYVSPPTIHHSSQPLYQSSQPFVPRNVPPSPSSQFRHLASPRGNMPQMRSPSLPHARVAEQSYLGGSTVGSPSGRQMNNLTPLPTVSLEQPGDLPLPVRSPQPEQPALVTEPVPVTVSSPPSQPPPQPPPPPVEEPPIQDELKEEDDTLRFAGGPIPTPNAESAIVFAVPGSVTSPPPTTTQDTTSAGTEPSGPTEEIVSPLPLQTFTSAPIFFNASLDTVDSSVAQSSSPLPAHLSADTPDSHYSIAIRRPEVGNAPGLSFSRRAKIPAHVAAAAVPLPIPPKPVPTASPAPVPNIIPGEHATNSTNIAEAAINTSKSDPKGTRKAPAGKTPKGQKKAGSKLPSEPSAQPAETGVTQTQSAGPQPTSDPVASAPKAQTSRPASPEVAPATAPQPAPPVKQPPKSWAALLRPATPAKSTKVSQPQGQNATQGNVASAQPGTEVTPPKESKVNGHTGVNGTIEPLPTNVPLHVVLADGVKPYSALYHPTKPRGLINSGNMCFANVVLQALVYSTPFVRLFETLGRLVPGNLDGKTTLYEAIILFLREFPSQRDSPSLTSKPKPQSGSSTPMPPERARQQSWNEDPFIPELLYEALRQNKRFDSMQRGHQEDAEEFLGFLLDTLHEELLTMLSRVQANPTPAGAAWDNDANGKPTQVENTREVQRPVSPGQEDESGWLEVGKKNKAAVTRTTRATESAITKIFGGKLRSVLQTPGSKDSVTLEPYQPLQLDIQSESVRTVEDALKHITLVETVSVFSETRGGIIDAKKHVTLETLPPLLILHLKRLVYDAKGIQKNSKVIEYTTSLDIRPEIVSPTRRTKDSIKYHLYGVVYHHGKHATGGHYTIDVLRQDLSEWVRIDDTYIESVTEKDVTAHEKHAKLDKTAYLLFYRRAPDSPK